MPFDLLRSGDKLKRLYAEAKVEELVEEDESTGDEVGRLLEVLDPQDEGLTSWAWSLIDVLQSKGLMTRYNAEKRLELLKSECRKVEEDAWSRVKYLLS